MSPIRHWPGCPSQHAAPIQRVGDRVTVTITACTGCLALAADEPLFDDLGDA